MQWRVRLQYNRYMLYNYWDREIIMLGKVEYEN